MRIRRFAAALVVLGALAAAAPGATQQRERWQGIAVNRYSFGITSEHDMPSADALQSALLNNCAANGWSCVVLATVTNCAAIAYNEQRGFNYTSSGATAQEATQRAYAKCANDGKYCDNDMSTCPSG